jgi:integrase
LEKIIKHSAEHLKPIIEFLFLTGLRLQNFKLKWADIDVKNRQIIVVVKQNKSQIILIIKPLVKLLLKIRREQIQKFGRTKDSRKKGRIDPSKRRKIPLTQALSRDFFVSSYK